eukprot:2695425-Pleurochrysis_carterae.AAC.1
MDHGGDRGTRGCGGGIGFGGENAQQVPAATIACVSVRAACGIAGDGATIYLLASSAVSGGKPEEETVLPAEAGAAVPVADCADVDCACDRVWRAVDGRLGGNEEPWAAKIGFRGDG